MSNCVTTQYNVDIGTNPAYIQRHLQRIQQQHKKQGSGTISPLTSSTLTISTFDDIYFSGKPELEPFTVSILKRGKVEENKDANDSSEGYNKHLSLTTTLGITGNSIKRFSSDTDESSLKHSSSPSKNASGLQFYSPGLGTNRSVSMGNVRTRSSMNAKGTPVFALFRKPQDDSIDCIDSMADPSAEIKGLSPILGSTTNLKVDDNTTNKSPNNKNNITSPKGKILQKKHKLSQNTNNGLFSSSKHSVDKKKDATKDSNIFTSSHIKGPLCKDSTELERSPDKIFCVSDLKQQQQQQQQQQVGPMRFQLLPRTFASRLGITSILAERQYLGALRFNVRPHPIYSDVVEVIDCEENEVVYRKVSRSDKSWRETFHEVLDDESDMDICANMAAYDAGQSTYPVYGMNNLYDTTAGLNSPSINNGGANPLSNIATTPGGTRVAGLAAPYGSVRSLHGLFTPHQHTFQQNYNFGSCATFQSTASLSDQNNNHKNTMKANTASRTVGHVSEELLSGSNVTTAVTNTPCTNPVYMQGNMGWITSTTSVPNHRAMMMGLQQSIVGLGAIFEDNKAPRSIDRGILWEALTPYPNQFPLHVRDTRNIIDTISLVSMVLDRYQFCYRYQLGNNKMRWVAKRVRKTQLALHCYVRSALVAEIFVDYEKGYSPCNNSQSQFGNGSTEYNNTAQNTSSVVSSTSDTAMPSELNTTNNIRSEGSDDERSLVEDGTFPLITILPAAFIQLCSIDSDVVESFLIFTGMQMLECLHIQ